MSTPNQYRRKKLQAGSHINASFADAVSVLAGLTSEETISEKDITCQYQKDVGQKPGFQRRRIIIIFWQLLSSKHVQIIFSRLRQKNQTQSVKGEHSLPPEG